MTLKGTFWGLLEKYSSLTKAEGGELYEWKPKSSLIDFAYVLWEDIILGTATSMRRLPPTF